MKFMILAKRTWKEILRDPLNLAFGLGFPLVVLGLLSAIQANVPVPLFEIDKLAPGVTVFGLAFMTLFSALLVSKDRTSALLMRLYTTPLKPADYILGYLLPMLPIALMQTAICYIFGMILGLSWTPRILLCLVLSIPTAMVFISLGLLCGSVFNDKQVGGAFKKIAELLPFYHAVELQRAAYAGDFGRIPGHLWWVVGYAAVLTVLSVWAFLHQMRKN